MFLACKKCNHDHSDFSVETFCNKIVQGSILSPKITHIQIWTVSKYRSGHCVALSVHPPRKGDLSVLLHDIVLVIVRQRPHQAKVPDLHSMS